MNSSYFVSAAEKREAGKALYYNEDSTCDERSQGVRLILEAYRANDPEAIYIVASLFQRGCVVSPGRDEAEVVFEMIARSANRGYEPARELLNAYCKENYSERFGDIKNPYAGAKGLFGFDGEPITINRKGRRTPIDAVLVSEMGRNVLKISTNVRFIYAEDMPNQNSFEWAVIRGLLAWQGDYEVFGGQKLTVEIDLTLEQRLRDSLLIFPIAGDMASSIQSFTSKVTTGKRREQVNSIFLGRRSFAFSGLGWRANSHKLIYVQSQNDRFDDYDEIMHVAKHEFGHTLGLGDLYSSSVDSLAGVARGTYPELDCYATGDREYNLVMCDHWGPISNNDIEMVVLAFKENRMQLYQPMRWMKRISSALGRGN